jgi:hypothetical protein
MSRSRRHVPVFCPRVELLEDRCCPSGSQWVFVGPSGAATPPGDANGPTVSGRVDVAVADPLNPNIVYVGCAEGEPTSGGGGIWRTTDFLTHSDPSGPTWIPLTDNMPSLSIFAKCLAIAPSNPNILYAAAQGPDGCILKTVDGGKHWTPLAESQFANAEFGAVVINPKNPNIVYVAVRDSVGGSVPGGDGVWESKNGGLTWANITATPIGHGGASDLVMGGAKGQILYAGIVNTFDPSMGTPPSDTALNGVWQSTNGGISWTQMTNGINYGNGTGTGNNPPPGVDFYIRLAMQASNPNVVYAMMFEPGNTSSNPLVDWFSTMDGATTAWTKLVEPTNGGDWRFWHMVLAVDPNNPDIVYTNSSESMPGLLASSTGGTTPWQSLSGSAEDVVNVFFDDPTTGNPNSAPSSFILVGDRGIQTASVTDNAGALSAIFTGKRGNLGNFLIYNSAVDPLNPSIIYSVSQDQLADLQRQPNGAWKYTYFLVGNTPQSIGNELGRMLVDPTNDQVVYSLRDREDGVTDIIQMTNNGGATWTPIINGLNLDEFPEDSDAGGANEAVYNAFVLDPNNPNRVLVGAQGIWAGTYDGNPADFTWKEITPIVDPTGGSDGGPAQVTALAVAPTNSNILYAATDNGKFWTINLGAMNPAWTEIDSGLPVSSANVTMSIQVDPTNPQRVFINVGGVGVHRVFETTTGGTSGWTPADGNLPTNLAVDSLAVDWRFQTPILYAGTDRGVYQSLNGGATWKIFGTGLPNTEADDLELLPQYNLLTASTFGRGVWQTTVTTPTVPVKLLYYGDQGVNLGGGDFGYLVTFQNTSASAISGPITLSFYPALPFSVPIVGVQQQTSQGPTPITTFTRWTITLPDGMAAHQLLTLLVIFDDPNNTFVVGQAQVGIPVTAFSDITF